MTVLGAEQDCMQVSQTGKRTWWDRSSPLSVCCLDFSLGKTYPRHHRPLWPPQPIAASDLLKKWVLSLGRSINSSMRSYQCLRGVRERHGHGEPPQKPSPVFSPCPILSVFPRHTLDASAKCTHCAGAGRLHEVGTHKSRCGTCHSTCWEQRGAYWQVCPQYQYINPEEIPQGKDNNLLYQIITLMSQDCK